MRLRKRTTGLQCLCILPLSFCTVVTLLMLLHSNELIRGTSKYSYSYSSVSDIAVSNCNISTDLTIKLEELEFSTSDDTSHELEMQPLSLSNKTIVIGKLMYKTPKVFLVIGIPSIRRINGHSYLLNTIQSVIDGMVPSEKLQVRVVVFLSDVDPIYNGRVAETILMKYGGEVRSGLLTILRVTAEYYPKLDGLHRNFGDSKERVEWRAKQVADYAALFAFSVGRSRFYLQLEDDVQCANRFVGDIRDFIHKQKSRWAVLEFSELGFIGKLFRTEDLSRLSRYMLMFYAEQPVDWLLTAFRLSMGQRQILLRKPTLFQHFGVKSSFDTTRDNNLKDRYFGVHNISDTVSPKPKR